MKIVCISDTHSQHGTLDSNDRLPLGDIIIHAGDATSRGSSNEIEEFLQWFSALPHPVKILIAGNHDWGFERSPHIYRIMCRNLGIVYLEDDEYLHKGVKFWGSPIQPEFFNWAFNRDRGADIQKHWDLIPTDVDVLITHGPPWGILDKVPGNRHAGCVDLLHTIVSDIKPKFHIFGHIHEGRGIQTHKTNDGSEICFINASTLDGEYRPYKEEAISFELDI